jgi:hypothetical protein
MGGREVVGDGGGVAEDGECGKAGRAWLRGGGMAVLEGGVY